MYKVILFYKYVQIDDPEGLKKAQIDLLKGLTMRGRMIIAQEGINGTFEGKSEDVEVYMETMKKDPRFADIHWKVSDGTSDGMAFPRLRVKVRPEIVSLHLHEEDINPNEITGTHLKPEELRKWYDEGKEFYIVDMRNDYELKVGKFEGTIFPGMENFRDLREKVVAIKDLKDKTVLTVCTGGVRCEKASGFLKKEGFTDVYQLDGGIVSYMEKFPSADFKGALYVFDNRITMHFDEKDKHEIIGRCDRCETLSEQYVNCSNMQCHRHFICCEECLDRETGKAYCNSDCEQKALQSN